MYMDFFPLLNSAHFSSFRQSKKSLLGNVNTGSFQTTGITMLRSTGFPDTHKSCETFQCQKTRFMRIQLEPPYF